MSVFGFFRDGNVRVWFATTIAPSLLPVMTSIVWSMMVGSTEFDDYLKMTDIVFVGLSVNISSLSLWRSRLTLVDKRVMMGWASWLLVLLSVCLAVAYRTWSLPGFAVVLALLSRSIWVNFSYNKRVWDRSIKNKRVWPLK
jgi:hypothetical protein